MSSPWKRSETSNPSARGLRDDMRNRRSGQHSPYRPKTDSVASSVWEEFNRLYIDEDRGFHKGLDDQLAEQERLHKEALAIAAAEHERVRESAERARERVELEIERERKRREEEELRVLDAARREKVEREAAERKRLKEELERQAEDQKKRLAEEKDIETTRTRLAEQKRREEEEAGQKKKQEDEERERKSKEQASSAAAAATKATENAQAQPAAAAPSTGTAIVAAAAPTTQPGQGPPATHAHPSPAPAQAQPTPSAPVNQIVQSGAPSLTNSAAEREATHRRYLGLHKRLKEMRKYVVSESKKSPALKKQLGDWRRKVVQTVGQLTTEKGGNRKPLLDMTQTLQQAQQFSEPSVDVSSYIISTATDGSPIPMSGAFIYLLNILSKSVISQLINEASVSPKIAEPIGIMAVSIFSQPLFKAKDRTVSLIDILLAKYHAVCPILWGIYGSEKTAQGRTRIGWWKEDGSWVGEQRHIERMTGLGAGYGALALRDFSKSKNDNPYPPSNYWKSLSYIVNTPPTEAQPTHFYVLKALIDGYIPRFVGFYGQAGLVALRKALVDFPAQAPRNPARDAVLVMPETFKRDLKLTL
ncbi:hypothetical protein AAFC00_005316 [Neodothiora populina]|uniref:mRNA export factor GLE1 n=1 Tax=Neodothiora populina TaxID=2781224 RepID=A0ABR3PLL3_9PEZI